MFMAEERDVEELLAGSVLSAGMGRIRNVLSHFFPTQVFNVFFRY